MPSPAAAAQVTLPESELRARPPRSAAAARVLTARHRRRARTWLLVGQCAGLAAGAGAAGAGGLAAGLVGYAFTASLFTGFAALWWRQARAAAALFRFGERRSAEVNAVERVESGGAWQATVRITVEDRDGTLRPAQFLIVGDTDARLPERGDVLAVYCSAPPLRFAVLSRDGELRLGALRA